jgi:pyruvate dehydrogenase E1 component
VAADVWSVTSWTELRRDALAADQQAFTNPDGDAPTPYLTSKLEGAAGPFVAVSDYDHLVPDQIRPWVPGEMLTLGADGFGFSDTRPAVRRHFLIDTQSIVTRALQALAKRGEVDSSAPAQAVERYRLLDVNSGTTGTAGGDS